MKRIFKRKRQRVVKGTSSAVILSILIHAGLFLLAGLLVVLHVTKPKPAEFEAPTPVERPKMKLTKPKVKVKKNTKPKTTRIVSKVPRASMPDIQLPEVSGMGDALSSDISAFEMIPPMDEMPMVGVEAPSGNDLQGTFYDFKRRADGGRQTVAMTEEDMIQIIRKFVKNGWKTSDLSEFYQSDRKLYATSVMIPTVRSSIAPLAFGEDTEPYCWAVVYRGKLVYPEPITFRFWGFGDDLMDVRVDGKVVLVANYPAGDLLTIGDFWHSDAPESDTYFLSANASATKAIVGDWITLQPGEEKNIQILIGEVPGGSFSAMLNVEVKGQTYKLNNQGGPILPMFKTAKPSLALRDQIMANLYPGDTDIMGGPIFTDFLVEDDTNATEVASTETNKEETVATTEEEEKPKDEWHLANGKTIKGEYRSFMGGKVVIKTAKKMVKIPKEELSPEDQTYVELLNPPRLNLDFLHKSRTVTIPLTPAELGWGSDPAKVVFYSFGVRAKQKSAGTYNHKLTIEFFAIGRQRTSYRPRYSLFDRQTVTFTPTKENHRSLEYRSPREVRVLNFVSGGENRGRKYEGGGYLITVTDERGKIIQHQASSPWLFEHLDNLKKLPLNAYLNDKCERVPPTGPKPIY